MIPRRPLFVKGAALLFLSKTGILPLGRCLEQTGRCARRRVSERNRRTAAALSAEMCSYYLREVSAEMCSYYLREEVKRMRITLHIGRFTVTIIVKSRNRHSAK